jgi:GNAT superfamily N-acetyltransferase
MEVTVERIVPETLVLVEPLFADYQRFYEVEEIDPERNRAFLERFVGSDEEGWLFGAFEDGRILGFTCLHRARSSLRAADTVLMYDLFVVTEARGKGVGRALIETALEVTRQSGAAALEWSTAPDNEAAQRLYDSIPGAEKSNWLEYEVDV